MKSVPWFNLAALFAAIACSSYSVAATKPIPLPKTPDAEVAAMDVLLSDVEKTLQTPESLEPFLYTTSTLGSRLDTFEMRFGIQPDKIPAWANLQRHARKILAQVDGKHANAIYFNADSAETGTCVLLELSGDSKRALRRLDEIKPGGGCGNWMASVMLAVNLQKSGVYQREGDYPKALLMMEAARSDMSLALGVASPDLLFSRYAFLLGKTGKDKEAVGYYQRVVDLYPQTVGDEIARQALDQRHVLIEPDIQRINQLYVEGSGRSDYDAAIRAIGLHRFAGSFDYLIGKLKDAEPWKKNRIIPALGDTGDPRAVEVLHEIVRDGTDSPNTMHALAALGKFGDRSEIVPYLRQCAKKQKNDLLDDSYWLDSLLHEIYGDGPTPVAVSEQFYVSSAEVARRWLVWIGAKDSEQKAG